MNKQFIYGFLTGLIIISFVLGSQYGNHFNFLKKNGFPLLLSFGEALNWKTLIVFCIVFLLIFKNIQGKLINKIFLSFTFLMFSWSIFDSLWIIKDVFTGNYLFGSSTLSFLSSKQVNIGFLRNILMFLSSVFFIKKWLIITKETLFSIFIFSFYWIILFFGLFRNIPQKTNPSFWLMYNPIYYLINFFPFITAFKEGSKKSWLKFLFA